MIIDQLRLFPQCKFFSRTFQCHLDYYQCIIAGNFLRCTDTFLSFLCKLASVTSYLITFSKKTIILSMISGKKVLHAVIKHTLCLS